jgi:hypothetical protein
MTRECIKFATYALCIAFFVYGALTLNYYSIGFGVIFLMIAENAGDHY